MKKLRLGGHAVIAVGHPFQSKRFCSGPGIRLLRGMNVKRGSLDWSPSITRHWPGPDPTLTEFQVHAGDIIVAMDGALVGKSCARAKPADLPAYLVQRVARIRCSGLLDQSFAYHFIASALFDRHVARRKTHTAIPHISKRDIEDFEMPAYSHSNQRRLGNLLDQLDAMKGILSRLYAARKKQRAGLAARLLAGELRLHGFAPGGSKRGAVPAGWRWCRLEDVADVTFSSVDKVVHAEEIPVRLCNYMDVWRNQYVDDDTLKDRGTATAREIAQFSLRPGDVVLTKDSETREDIAASACVRSISSGVVLGYHLALVRPRDGLVCGSFLAKQLALQSFRKQFVRAASGATRYGLSLRTVRRAEVCLPPPEEQIEIATLLERVDSQLSILAAEARAFHSLKCVLMTYAIKGAIPELPPEFKF
jgi:restriction endonuclease S subunit